MCLACRPLQSSNSADTILTHYLGAEIEMTIRGDILLYKNAVGGVGQIRSEVFTRAMCDTYYGSDPVSPGHKEAVLEGIPKL